MHQQVVQSAFDRMQFRQPHVLDLLDNMGPIDGISLFPACETAQQIGLMLGPGQDVAFIQTVWHCKPKRQTGHQSQPSDVRHPVSTPG
jgi:hypothetical protein